MVTIKGESSNIVFQDYAQYYDLIYRDKNYRGEADYVAQLLRGLGASTGAILEFGCGTGAHAEFLAQGGYLIDGVDLSNTMLAIANERRLKMPEDIQRRVSFKHGDAANIRMEHTYDAVVALFHVLSYQTSNLQLQKTVLNARNHAKPGGLFVFDCWYGPAVLAMRPEKRQKIFENEILKITRNATPSIYPNQNVVRVHYQISLLNKSSGKTSTTEEVHEMRYFFLPELELILETCGFVLEKNEEFLTGNALGFDTWGACFAARCRLA